MAAAGVKDFSLQVKSPRCFLADQNANTAQQAALLFRWALNEVSLKFQDVYKPDSTRLRRNLSAVINFAKFREEKLVPYTEMQERTISLLEKAEHLQAANLQQVMPLLRSIPPASQSLIFGWRATTVEQQRKQQFSLAASCHWACLQ